MRLTLPYPPTTNNLFINVGKYRVPSVQAKQYKKVIGGNKAFPGIVLEVREPRDDKILDYIECELTA